MRFEMLWKMDFWHKSYLFGGIEMQENSKMYMYLSYHVKILISSEKFRDISRNFVIFRDTKFREIKKYIAQYEINISRNTK
jgi:hypothetical protein